jgi:hypothetical protein
VALAKRFLSFQTRELHDVDEEEDEEMGRSGPPVLKMEAFLVGLKSSKPNHRPKFRVQPLQQKKKQIRVRRGWRRS